MFDLTGKKALITGASGGLGWEIAKKLHKLGAEIVISGTRKEKLEKLASELGDRVHVQTANLSDRESVKELFVNAEKVTGGIDILVNNAGITRDGLSMRMKDQDWDDVINVNLTSAFILCRSASKAMMRRRYGRIINISSVVGVSGNPGQMNYCASKAGIIGMSKSLAQEVANRGITVNNIAPGFILSDMTEELNDKQKESILKNIPTGTLGKPEDIANSVAFLSSDEASYITGQTLHINGGMLMI
ncbi:MAG: 3-oxoacyl-ACP reductase FabG [Alphaproteobacteria bacterium]|nr:3-oxoacyl-ACP reductase FabG [Alphaproteobacteria bacterium]